MKYLFLYTLFYIPFAIFSQLPKKEINPMNVLFIGNSYTHYHNMPFIFEKMAVSKNIKINVEMNAKSNHTFKMHSARTEMYDAIRSKKWDYVVLQGFSRELKYSKEHIDTSSLPYFKIILDSIYTVNPCTNVLLFMTWGYENGYTELDSSSSSTYLEMFNSIEFGYKYLSSQFDIPIVPVGHVWKLFRQKHPSINLYHEDGQHPNLNGSYLAASSFYSSIFKSSAENSFIPKMDSLVAKNIQKLAFDEISISLDTFLLNHNLIRVTNESKGKNLYLVKGYSNFEMADSLVWDLGNGTQLYSKTFIYQYKSPGTYLIKLTVYDKCGVREMYKKIIFKPFIRPKTKIKSKN